MIGRFGGRAASVLRRPPSLRPRLGGRESFRKGEGLGPATSLSPLRKKARSGRSLSTRSYYWARISPLDDRWSGGHAHYPTDRPSRSGDDRRQLRRDRRRADHVSALDRRIEALIRRRSGRSAGLGGAALPRVRHRRRQLTHLYAWCQSRGTGTGLRPSQGSPARGAIGRICGGVALPTPPAGVQDLWSCSRRARKGRTGDARSFIPKEGVRRDGWGRGRNALDNRRKRIDSRAGRALGSAAGRYSRSG